jgi:hypothetical protein
LFLHREINTGQAVQNMLRPADGTPFALNLMQVSSDINYEELARSSDDFNAAQLKAVSHGGATSASSLLHTREPAFAMAAGKLRIIGPAYRVMAWYHSV